MSGIHYGFPSERLRWFHEARFGLFVHWGLYSLLGRGEWAMFHDRIPAPEYEKLAGKWNPEVFDAARWAALALEAGMKYAVLTARHHDGFCLYDSQVSDFTSVKTAARRDFVGEYVAACRAAGLRVGLYYSLMDWRFPGYFHPDGSPKSQGVTREGESDSAGAMREQAHAQVRELMSNYGPIDVLWYDGLWINHDPQTDSSGFWEPQRLNAMVRELQPGILINNRAGSREDLDTPEQFVKASEPGRGWETCMTIGDAQGWGYVKHNPNWKTPASLLQTLCLTAAGEGNFLLNIGPHPDGTVREEETSRLQAMGEWLRVNGEAIYGSQRCELSAASLGCWTARENVGYLHVFRWPGREAVVPLVDAQALNATVLATGQKASLRRASNGRLIIGDLPEAPPDPCVSVIRVEFAQKPRALPEPDRAAWLRGEAG